MALDIKMEVFSYNTFRYYWYALYSDEPQRKASDVYGQERLSNFDYEETCDDVYLQAMDTIANVFETTCNDYIHETRSEFSDSFSDLFNYIVRTCSCGDWLENFTIFDHMFVTCKFVILLGMYCLNNNIHRRECLQRHIHVCWAMYFDRFTEEFYEQGGWMELRKMATSYKILNKPIRNPQILQRIFNLHKNLEFYEKLGRILNNLKRLCHPSNSRFQKFVSGRRATEALQSEENKNLTDDILHYEFGEEIMCTDFPIAGLDSKSENLLSGNTLANLIKIENQNNLRNISINPQFEKIADSCCNSTDDNLNVNHGLQSTRSDLNKQITLNADDQSTQHAEIRELRLNEIIQQVSKLSLLPLNNTQRNLAENFQKCIEVSYEIDVQHVKEDSNGKKISIQNEILKPDSNSRKDQSTADANLRTTPENNEFGKEKGFQ
ncbi:uncharacterized protein CEXT_23021 [Caerostris extrusa]|uniref:Uncharacterized protein n=1 Tax=Caerostris extrusa TaxID=172846 RepID=A0AAV4UNI8_CAEEX|nr:uncharacterized protein CEXT_23021 [Caerostris extrusa]